MDVKKLKLLFPPYIFFLFKLLTVQVILFGIFRLVFIYLNFNKIDPQSYRYFKLVLFDGLRFDIVVSCYILIVPFVVLSFDYFFLENNVFIRKWVRNFLGLLLMLSFLICSADLPFFAFFNSRLTTSVFLWKGNLWEMFSFILGDPAKYPFILLFLALTALIIYLLIRFNRSLFKEKESDNGHNWKHKLLVVFSFLMAIIIGMRGGFSAEAFTINSIRYTDHYFINQLSWNPVLSFYDSFRTFSINYLEPKDALLKAKNYLNVRDGFDSPIAREIKPPEKQIKANVILIIMESMSAEKMGTFGNKNNLTPTLDELAANGLSFSRFYTNGIHTCNGIFGSLFAFPSLMNQHPMNNTLSTSQDFTGFYHTFSHHQYQTSFICTNNENFDNMGYFVRRNGCDEIYSMKDFPKDKIVSSWGPPDETLFEFALEKINSKFSKESPFFTTLLTISTHEPYVLPGFTNFKPKTTDHIDRLYEYADWAIGRFMDSCKQQPWFDETIFVFVADHGINSTSAYEMPLSFHHSPFIIYAPKIITSPKVISKVAMQSDVFPTIMGLLQIPYINNTFGMDLLNESRPFAYFSADDKLGVISDDYYLTIMKSGERSIYNLKNNSETNLIAVKKPLADSMQTYAMSMLQTAQWMLMNKLAGPQEKNNKHQPGN